MEASPPSAVRAALNVAPVDTTLSTRNTRPSGTVAFSRSRIVISLASMSGPPDTLRS